MADSGFRSGGHKLECIPNSIESTDASSTVTNGGPEVKLISVNTNDAVPRTDYESNWRQANGKLLPCSKCILPTSDVVSE